MIRRSSLPQSIVDLVELVGVDAALALVRDFGGTVLRVPFRERREGRTREALVTAMGETAALAFIDRYSGETLAIARCAAALRDRRDAAIIAAYDAGASVARLARDNRLTDRQVRTILKRCPGEAGAFAFGEEPSPGHPQGRLF